VEAVRVAAVVMQSSVGKTSDNLVRIESFVREAAAKGVQLICFPEASITGYTIEKVIRTYAEPVPGPSSDVLVRLSKSTGLTILSGLIERGEGGDLFISHLVATPQGLGDVYRKLHLAPNEESAYSQGNELPTYRYGDMTFGIQLCYDTHFPEVTTILTLKGMEILFLPYASPRETPKEKRDRWLRYLSARAYDNSIFVVACNQVGCSGKGVTFPGVALILDPKGRIMAEACGDVETIAIADLTAKDIEDVRRSDMGFFLRRRRPEICKDMSVLKIGESGSKTLFVTKDSGRLN